MAKKSLEKQIDRVVANAQAASNALRDIPVKKIDRALMRMAALLDSNRKNLCSENLKDIRAAREKGLSQAMVDRLTLSDKVIDSMIAGMETVAGLSTPINTVFDSHTRADGLKIAKVRVPIGVIGIIYESRPNVTVDASAICLKSLNAVILRGGSEALHSNRALGALFSQALTLEKLPAGAVQVIGTTDREAVALLLKKCDDIDLIIPRGGEGLIRMVVENSLIPVIKHYKGVCHVYVSRHADMRMALPIVINAKIQRPGVCNAMETLLIDAKLPQGRQIELLTALLDKGVVLYGDTVCRSLDKRIKRATVEDWKAEYLDLRLAVRIVDGVDEAIDHINCYGSHHTDAIVSASVREIARFQKMVDSASVMTNASTRLADGGEYGLGCEIGISTDKLHARGPMGVADLTSYKWIVEGNGHIRT
jgi:glutamate-5-semialdehyde dehydrogenase